LLDHGIRKNLNKKTGYRGQVGFVAWIIKARSMSFPRRRESRKVSKSHPEFISGSFSIDAETSSA
jgi:hypothetical protein